MPRLISEGKFALQRLRLACYPVTRREADMNAAYQNFVLKWYLFGKFCDAYLDGSPFKLNRLEIKRAVRPREKRNHSRDEAVNQVFSQLLNSGPQQSHVAWICGEIQRQLPFLNLTEDIWSDDCDLVAFCGILVRKATGAGLGDNQGHCAIELASALQVALTGAERLIDNDPAGADTLINLSHDPAGGAQDRGLGGAGLAPDPRRFRFGDLVTLKILPPDGASGQFDLYLWETWNPNSATLPEHERRAPWEPGAKPILQPLPPLRDQRLPRNDHISLSDRLTDSTGLGWHHIGVVGVNRTSGNKKVRQFAESLRKVLESYHADHPADDAGVYDLRTHESIIREVYFFIGRDRLENGMIGSDSDVFVGRCSYEIIE